VEGPLNLDGDEPLIFAAAAGDYLVITLLFILIQLNGYSIFAGIGK